MSQKVNELQTSQLSKKQLCDRTPFFTWEKKRHEPKICPSCGHEHKQERRAVEAADGSLVEMTEEEMAWQWARYTSLKKVMNKVKCKADLDAIAKVRAYKPSWAW